MSASPTALTFTPSERTAAVGLLFYPGALVEPYAYAPLARAVAEAGYEVVIVKLPLRLAPLEHHRRELTTRTRAFIAQDEERRAWVVGGHSRGGLSQPGSSETMRTL